MIDEKLLISDFQTYVIKTAQRFDVSSKDIDKIRRTIVQFESFVENLSYSVQKIESI